MKEACKKWVLFRGDMSRSVLSIRLRDANSKLVSSRRKKVSGTHHNEQGHKARFKRKVKDLTVCKSQVAKDLPGRDGRKNVSPEHPGRNQWFTLILAQLANEHGGSAHCSPMRERMERSVK